MNAERLVQVLLMPPRAGIAAGVAAVVQGDRRTDVEQAPAIVLATLTGLLDGDVFARHSCLVLSVAAHGGVMPTDAGALALVPSMLTGPEPQRTGQLQLAFSVYPHAHEIAAGDLMAEMGSVLVMPDAAALVAAEGVRALLHGAVFGTRTVSLLLQPKHYPPCFGTTHNGDTLQ
jgi:hypothetical protein